ncbi:inorganic H+ pyrophosphatase [Fragilariopsis cylindrus CCMP1102]|uniref:H(+)-exporting diphosphatase n=1 Tax=Fragilariopsis cylindrus CCMP1102 TaxID=635003 RepID=A0A1E7FCC0_9STRA|nr:inorganic H+ pyrophosphatase [Fragilariopsis cylindrus CCMP1102]|eukprot:OEU15801.1 inorganic H+ pyrophosphatase [Fragilariopsis cylindrus CCMP1102]
MSDVNVNSENIDCLWWGLPAGNFPCDASPIEAVSFAVVCGGISLLFVAFLMKNLRYHQRGNDEMNKISDKIKSGSRAFLVTEYKYLAIFVVIMFLLLFMLYALNPLSTNQWTDGIRYGLSFLSGAVLSAIAGWGGMLAATDANVRTTQAAEKNGLPAALRVAFTGGSVAGFTVVGLGILGVSLTFFCLTLGYSTDYSQQQKIIFAADALAGFGFGASSIALFTRVAGGIFTKAADIGADLVGKIEMDIPEDDHRNPAVIADNVGDNVGDVAGMSADLFESFVGSIIAAVVLANGDIVLVMLPFWIAGSGIIASIFGYFIVGTKEEASQKDLLFALHKGSFVASVLTTAFSGLIIAFFFEGRQSDGWAIFGCIVIGLVAGILIGQITEYFTSYSYWPAQSIANAGVTGPGTAVIQGLGIGMFSTVFPAITIVVTILACNVLFSSYGIAMASVGMLSTLGFTLATDCFGPIADNAGGIAEMAKLPPSVRGITDALDALGNTTAATGKGFAIGSAVLTALSLLAAFKEKAGIQNVDISDPVVLSGVLIGAMLPFLFAALTMLSVRKTAGAIIIEVRRQFKEIPGLREGTAEADSDRCVEISTRYSIQEMILPGIYSVFSPATIGFLIGPNCLAGLLAGAIASGMMLATMMSNAGGAWDNAKKYIEIEGAHGGKGSPTHKACIVGDTVGDPFKDTSGPALNILIKLMSIVALTIAPSMNGYGDWETAAWGLIPLFIMIVGTILVWFLTRQVTTNTGGSDSDIELSTKNPLSRII